MNSIASRNGGGGFEESKAVCRTAKNFAGTHRGKTCLASRLAEHVFTRCTPAAGRPRRTALLPSLERAIAKGDSDSWRLIEPGRFLQFDEPCFPQVHPPGSLRQSVSPAPASSAVVQMVQRKSRGAALPEKSRRTCQPVSKCRLTPFSFLGRGCRSPDARVVGPGRRKTHAEARRRGRGSQSVNVA